MDSLYLIGWNILLKTNLRGNGFEDSFINITILNLNTSCLTLYKEWIEAQF